MRGRRRLLGAIRHAHPAALEGAVRRHEEEMQANTGAGSGWISRRLACCGAWLLAGAGAREDSNTKENNRKRSAAV